MGFQCEVISELFYVELVETYNGESKEIKRKFLCWVKNIKVWYFVPFILALAGGLMTGLRPTLWALCLFLKTFESYFSMVL